LEPTDREAVLKEKQESYTRKNTIVRNKSGLGTKNSPTLPTLAPTDEMEVAAG
jgi:hypothetical protein